MPEYELHLDAVVTFKADTDEAADDVADATVGRLQRAVPNATVSIAVMLAADESETA